MTKKELLDAVRTIVQEEVRTQLPTILIEILSEKVDTTRTVVSEAGAKSVQKPVARAPQQPKKYSSNPTLNAILNETQGGIPPEDSVTAGVTIPPEVLSENTALAGVANAMKRDYRQLIRAADKKAAASRGGPLNFQTSIPTTFEQEP